MWIDLLMGAMGVAIGTVAFLTVGRLAKHFGGRRLAQPAVHILAERLTTDSAEGRPFDDASIGRRPALHTTVVD
ncbi:MAG: hypothetical protein K2R98_14705 [Gemmataceae bacterium]|nr:hypothetical protein [Gemmataceae bacterium]